MKIITVVGARPQFIKAAPVSWVIRETPGIDEDLLYTGQHFDPEMSDLFLDELNLPKPTHSLGIHGGSHGEMTGRMLMAIEEALSPAPPDVVMVYGDTNSTLAGALAAAKLNLPVAHVEAGLRSFRRSMPEEINRVVADHLSTLLLCPTREAVRNLEREGICAGVFNVGDVMYDLAIRVGDRVDRESRVLDELGLQPSEYAVATVHRAENTDDPTQLLRVIDYLRERAGPVVLPLHPRTKRAVEEHGISLSGLLPCRPLGYLDMTRLVRAATCVYTDSGGLQKEAYFHRVPCVTLRDETEWVETVACGWNRLWTEELYLPRMEIADYGDGSAASLVVAQLLGLGGAAST